MSYGLRTVSMIRFETEFDHVLELERFQDSFHLNLALESGSLSIEQFLDILVYF